MNSVVRLGGTKRPKSLTRQDFTWFAKQSMLYVGGGTQGRLVMESTFANWRNAMVGVGLTVAVVGAGLAIAFM